MLTGGMYAWVNRGNLSRWTNGCPNVTIHTQLLELLVDDYRELYYPYIGDYSNPIEDIPNGMREGL